MTAPAVAICARCGTELAASLLRCPACGTLVHSGRLEQLAAQARQLETSGDTTGALHAWSQALTLLPRDAPQAAAILKQVSALEQAAGSPHVPAGPRQGGLKGVWVGIATVALFLLGKLKLLLLGFTKLGTVLSMLAFFGTYWGLYGWQFALGFVLCIYIHEMGHVAALRHYGLPATAPMFIPGFGALIRLKVHPPTPAQDARVGLAGPIWGVGAAIACLLLYRLTGRGLFASLVHVGAVINIFNLIPVWQLDGHRGIAPLARLERALLAGVALLAFAFTHEGMLVLVAIGLGFQSFARSPEEGDRNTLLEFAAVIGVLAWLATTRGAGTT